MELLKHNLESTGCIIDDSGCISKYNTSYIVKNSRNEDVKFSSHVFAKNYNDAMNKIKLRCLGEEIESIRENNVDSFLNEIEKDRPSYLFKINSNPFTILHGVCWLCNISKNYKSLDDVGILHDLIHYFEFGIYGGTQFINEEDIINKLIELEQSTPGYLP